MTDADKLGFDIALEGKLVRVTCPKCNAEVLCRAKPEVIQGRELIVCRPRERCGHVFSFASAELAN